MGDLVTKVAEARGLTAALFTGHNGHTLNEWVLVEPLRAPSTVDGVWDPTAEGKDGLYEELFRVVGSDFVDIPKGAHVVIVRQLAVKLQKEGALLAVKHANIIAVVHDEPAG